VTTEVPISEDLMPLARTALDQVEELLSSARQRLRGLVAPDGEVDGALLNKHQFAAHGFAWYATYRCAL
jgi:(2S)-methylsuccinyl-CoA dehydrogenase